MRKFHFLMIAVMVCFAGRASVQAASTTQPDSPAQERRAAFFHKNLVEAYETVGSRNAKWDGDARRVLKLAAERWMSLEPDPDMDWQILVIGGHAFRAGCDDPAVLYHLLRAHMSIGVDVPKDLILRLGRNVGRSGYAPFLKVFAWTRLLWFVNDGGKRQLLDQIYQGLPAMESELDSPQTTADLCVDLTEYGPRLDGDRKPIIEKLYGILAKAQPDSPTASLFLGLAYWRYSWDAPGVGGDEIPGSNRSERHQVAQASLERALVQDPNLAYASAKMVGLRVDEGVLDAETENYFQQAIRQDPDCLPAYRYKIGMLNTGQPGAEANLIQFGRVCLETQRWNSRIPFLLLRAHRSIAGQDGLVEFYKATPGAWHDVQNLYVGYIAYNPKAITERINYALIAIKMGRRDIAEKQLNDLKPMSADPILKVIIANESRGVVAALKQGG
jgi:tetratricopeptide (TPR) repeat protein